MTFNTTSNRSSVSPGNKSNVGSRTQPISYNLKPKTVKMKIDIKGQTLSSKKYKVGIIDLTSAKITS